MSKTLVSIKDGNGNVLPIIALGASQDVVSTSASVQSTAIDAKAVRIVSVSGDLRFLTGSNPVALAASPILKDGQEIWVPINPGDKVAILGGTANISEVGI